MRRSILLLAMVGMLVAALAIPAFARGKGNPNPQPQVYVTNQGLTYDSIVVTDLPFVDGAPYQLLEIGPTGCRPSSGPVTGVMSVVAGTWRWTESTGHPLATTSSSVHFWDPAAKPDTRTNTGGRHCLRCSLFWGRTWSETSHPVHRFVSST